MSRRAPVLVLAVAWLLGAGTAHAWRQACITNEYGTDICFHHTGNCISWSLNEEGSDNVGDFAAVHSAVWSAFSAWNEAGCSYMRFFESRVTSCGCKQKGYNIGEANVNLVAWCESYWSSDYPREAVALTFVHYDEATGEILDADVALNGATFNFGIVTDPAACDSVTDIQNTLTHEAGHMLGFDESQTDGSTLWPYTAACDLEKRSLEQDDKDGLCTLYPFASNPGVCRSPIGGLEKCGGCDCAAAPGAGAGESAFPALALAGLLLTLVAMRKIFFRARQTTE
jgi:hypothetical protein